ncbi:cobyric acid synthase [Iodobacter sp. CM08]|uniref:cobyric acid synthase n=1 Tax=Iodobacter sp. CM08 TaxID=3085902 RepID=UPI0029829F62|nr:cobyric acid synthase [Iodobacter sp. CM08]MDW5415489.1 cobyric acid synthase [Iodobacter sp. CM08]
MPTLMIQGCTSDAGKTTIVAALCRILLRRGIKVAPFKPQNMALNSAVTADSGEIGRAQAMQAVAAGIAAHTDFNPVLLKPSSDCRAQVIIQGKSIGNLDAVDYHAYKQTAKKAVFESWGRLQNQYEWVIVEGAGSPAEINLREGDIANMGFAEEADCPVWLVADIDRGGVFAHFVGTLSCLSVSEQARVTGFIINRFRGDIKLLQGGIDWLEQTTGKPVLAVVPYLHGLDIAAEDAVPRTAGNGGDFKIVIATLPHISNHTDFDPLRRIQGVDCSYATPNQPLPAADLLIIPGSKNTRGDLEWLRSQGWDKQIEKHLRFGGKVIGICGGYQMLGQSIADPLGLEGKAGDSKGLGWLPIATSLEQDKQLRNLSGHLSANGEEVTGYEIHHGETQILDGNATPLIKYANEHDGIITEQVLGCYLHGLFDSSEALKSLLAWAGHQVAEVVDHQQLLEQEIDRLSDALDQAIDWEKAKQAGLNIS